MPVPGRRDAIPLGMFALLSNYPVEQKSHRQAADGVVKREQLFSKSFIYY